jgi:hypothetical protein
MEATTLIISHYCTGGSFLYLKELLQALYKINYPVIFYVPQNMSIGIKDKVFRFVLKEPSTHPAFIKKNFLNTPSIFLNTFTMHLQ